MSSQTSLATRRQFLERSMLGFGSAFLLPSLLASCTDHRIPDPVGSNEDPVPRYSITNNTSQAIIVYYYYYNPDTDAASPRRYYEHDLDKVVGDDKSYIWAPGETKVGVRQNILGLPDDWPIQIMVMGYDEFYPIKAVIPQYNTQTQKYDPIVITQQDVASMANSEKFYKYLRAFPRSTLAKDYQRVINLIIDESLSKEAIDSEVANFFNGTIDFKLVTLENLAILNTYYQALSYVWTDYQPEKTYYLYSSDGNSTIYKGSLQIRLRFNDINFQLPSANVTFTYIDENNQQQFYDQLSYDSACITSEIFRDNPAFCLAGHFVDKSIVTNGAESGIESVLIGSIYGVSVIGTDQKPAEKHSWFYLLTHPTTLADYITIFLLIAGAMTGLDAFLGAVIFLYSPSRNEKQSDGSLASLIDQANQNYSTVLSSYQGSPIPVNTSLDDIPPF